MIKINATVIKCDDKKCPHNSLGICQLAEIEINWNTVLGDDIELSCENKIGLTFKKD